MSSEYDMVTGVTVGTVFSEEECILCYIKEERILCYTLVLSDGILGAIYTYVIITLYP